MRHRLAAPALALITLTLALVFVPRAVHAGEDPQVGVLSKTGIGGMGCVAVTSSGKFALQCLDSTSSTGARVRYRLMTATEFSTGLPVPTDGGGMTDGGIFGPLVDFTGATDPYLVQAKSNQSKLCVYAEDAGASGAFVTLCQISGAYP